MARTRKDGAPGEVDPPVIEGRYVEFRVNDAGHAETVRALQAVIGPA
jgi:hypothetical protein